MSSIDVANQIAADKSATAQYKASTIAAKTGSTEINSDTFLTLMLKELEYQDPMSPMDNKEFISQQAQFTQLSTIQEMNDNMNINNSIMQTLALVGKEVTLVDPDDGTKTITGIVDEAAFNGESSSIVVNSKEYPISLIKSVKQATTASTPTTAETTQEKTTTET